MYTQRGLIEPQYRWMDGDKIRKQNHLDITVKTKTGLAISKSWDHRAPGTEEDRRVHSTLACQAIGEVRVLISKD